MIKCQAAVKDMGKKNQQQSSSQEIGRAFGLIYYIVKFQSPYVLKYFKTKLWTSNI